MNQDLEDARELLATRFPNLTTKQLTFVAEYVASGGRKKDSAIAAGYAPASAHVEAHRLLNLPKIIKAVHELTVHRLGAALPGALATVMRLSSGAKSEYVQLEASKDLMDRAGMAAPKKVLVGSDVRVTFDLS